MKSVLIQLKPNPEQYKSLRLLQQTFAEICNVIYRVVQDSRCWNRVGLHHMVYHNVREMFPGTGSQIICNAIYAVSRTSRLVFQDIDSPWYDQVKQNVKLPKIIFLPQSPVFLDTHTISFTKQTLSIYTLNGRIHFDMKMFDIEKSDFFAKKYKEILLLNHGDDFFLKFIFSDAMNKAGEKGNIIDFPKSIMIFKDDSELDVNQNKAAC